jgi:hypothetical protein
MLGTAALTLFAGAVDTAKKRLDRIGVAIEKLGGMLSIRISSRHR